MGQVEIVPLSIYIYDCIALQNERERVLLYNEADYWAWKNPPQLACKLNLWIQHLIGPFLLKGKSSQNQKVIDCNQPVYMGFKNGSAFYAAYRILDKINAPYNQCRYGIRDPVLFNPLDLGSGSGMNFFRIPDLGSRIRPLVLVKFSYIIFRILVMLSLCNRANLKTYS
jgi:hypothetical protein